MDNKEFFEVVGGSYEEMLSRFGSDTVITMFVKKFEKDQSFQRLMEATERGDIKSAFEMAHTLKGIAANLCFGKMKNSADLLTEQLRSQTEQADVKLLEQVKKDYEEVIEQIKFF